MSLILLIVALALARLVYRQWQQRILLEAIEQALTDVVRSHKQLPITATEYRRLYSIMEGEE